MKLLLNYLKRLNNTKWNIGFFNKQNLLEQNYDINWLKHNYTDRWFADPFVLCETEDTIDLLVEEFYDKINRGRLTRLVVDKKTFVLLENRVVLELDEHLSFPAIYNINGTIYVVPECYQRNKLDVYKYNLESNSLEFYQTIIDGEFTDAIIYTTHGLNYLLSTLQPNPNGKELKVYTSECLFANYKLSQVINFSSNIARGAGNFFEYRGKLYRPAQNCNMRYGNGLVIQEVSLIDTNISLKDVKYIYPNSYKYNLGIHTLNFSSSLAVVDGLGFRNPIIGRCISILKRFI